MKPSEFYKIMTDFVEEEKFWRSLKEGDAVYQVQVVKSDGDFHYHKVIIIKIDIENRNIYGHYGRNKSHVITLTDFLTQKDYDTRTNPLIKD